jgi:hypothetical protein
MPSIGPDILCIAAALLTCCLCLQPQERTPLQEFNVDIIEGVPAVSSGQSVIVSGVPVENSRT